MNLLKYIYLIPVSKCWHYISSLFFGFILSTQCLTMWLRLASSLPHNPGWTPDPPASGSGMLGFQTYAATPSFKFSPLPFQSFFSDVLSVSSEHCICVYIRWWTCPFQSVKFSSRVVPAWAPTSSAWDSVFCLATDSYISQDSAIAVIAPNLSGLIQKLFFVHKTPSDTSLYKAEKRLTRLRCGQ